MTEAGDWHNSKGDPDEYPQPDHLAEFDQALVSTLQQALGALATTAESPEEDRERYLDGLPHTD